MHAQVPAHRQRHLARPVGRSGLAPVETALPSALESRTGRGSATSTVRAYSLNAFAARRHVVGMERAGHLQRSHPRAGRRLRREGRQGLERTGGDDLAGGVAVRRGEAGGVDGGQDVRPRRRRAPRTCRSARARTRRPSRRRGVRRGPPRPSGSAPRTPQPRSARRQCDRRRPARPVAVGVAQPELAGGDDAERDQISGWVTAVSLISSASAVVPSRAQIEAADVGERGRAARRHRAVRARARACPATARPVRVRVRRSRLPRWWVRASVGDARHGQRWRGPLVGILQVRRPGCGVVVPRELLITSLISSRPRMSATRR